MIELAILALPSGPELIIVLVVILLLFGSTKLPKLARSLGASVTEFKKGVKGGAGTGPDGDSSADPGSEKLKAPESEATAESDAKSE